MSEDKDRANQQEDKPKEEKWYSGTLMNLRTIWNIR
jgi:hypothetical protein